MSKKADIGSKRLIALSPQQWAQWVTQSDVQVLDSLSSEFEWISRQGDVLLRVVSPQLGEFLVATEIQLHYSTKMPRRMRAYAALAAEKYQLPVFAVLVVLLPPKESATIVDKFDEEWLGQKARQDFRALRLWEEEAAIALEGTVPALLPFVPIMKGGGNEGAIRKAAQLLEANETLCELENLLAFFASFVLKTEIIVQILRWDMKVLQESPWYQEILQEGKREGKREGLQEGEDKGLQKGKREVAMNLLSMGLSVEQIVQATGLSDEQLLQLQTNGHSTNN